MIKFTQLNGEFVWIALSQIAAVRNSASFEASGTHIEFDDGHFYIVKEPINHVIAEIQKCQAQMS